MTLTNSGLILTEKDTSYVNISGGGYIGLSSFQSVFFPLVKTNIIRADIVVKIGGLWLDRQTPSPDLDYDSGGENLQSATFNLNETETIEAIKIRLR